MAERKAACQHTTGARATDAFPIRGRADIDDGGKRNVHGNKTGQARLACWCKNLIGNGSQQKSWMNVKPGKTVRFVGECTFKARNTDRPGDAFPARPRAPIRN
ncbi:hypothetical protein ACGFNP_21460 [Nonomuraea sp. NPDC049269]|uniref:hypothetical protein n=1 Tax=Nonomuraea sp. NPDC049269 TaxID=3364349 RepID=UPI003711C86F